MTSTAPLTHVPQAPPFRGLGITALTMGIIAFAVPVIAIGLGLLSAVSGDPGWSMVTALLVLPVAGIAAVLVGLVAVILSIVLLIRSQAKNLRWIPALVLGIVGAATIPGFILLLSGTNF